MTLWTIQTSPAWNELEKSGRLRARPCHLPEPAWMPAYAWMTRQMRDRIGPPPDHDCQALWAWYRWNGPRRRPDLRCSGHLAKGEEGVRLELECSADRVLLSDFSLWHYVLNYWYLPSSEVDGDAFERELARHGLSFYEQKPLPDDGYHAQIVESWDRCLDLHWYEPDIAEPFEEKSIQATVWEITIDHVVECRRFTAR